MYEAFYDRFLPVFGPTTRILMTDTDSFFLAFSASVPLNEKLKQLQDIFDFSNYDENHPLRKMGLPLRSAQPGFFKGFIFFNILHFPISRVFFSDESRGRYLYNSFLGLCSKSYCLRYHDTTLPDPCEQMSTCFN